MQCNTNQEVVINNFYKLWNRKIESTVLYIFLVEIRYKDMKNLDSLPQEFYEYVEKNIFSDCDRLILKDRDRDYPFPVEFAITQIRCRRKTASKLSWLNGYTRFIYPCGQVAEQATHQAVARYHSMLAGHGKRVADLTAGLGVDAFTMALASNKVTAVEYDSARAEAIRHNAAVIGLNDLTTVHADCTEWIGTSPDFDVIFIDPARRDDADSRTFRLSDSLPDIISCRSKILEKTNLLMVKVSPFLDISSAIRELPETCEIHSVCVRGECKEIMIIMSGVTTESTCTPGNITVKVVDLPQDVDRGEIECGVMPCLISSFECLFSELGNSDAPVAVSEDISVGSYLYDPNAGMHKIGAGSKLCRDLPGLKRMGPNTDIYVSASYYENFPGRIFRIDRLADKKFIKSLKGEGRSVVTRNYPVPASSLKASMGLKEDDTKFLFGMRMGERDKNIILDCTRIK